MKSLMKDIDDVLADDRRASNRERQKTILVMLGAFLIVSLIIMKWTKFDEGFVRIFASIALGFSACIGVLLFRGFSDTSEFAVSDSTLTKLAALNIHDRKGLSELQDVLSNQGFITIGDVDQFAQGEQQERLRQVAISKVGAKSFLNLPLNKSSEF